MTQEETGKQKLHLTHKVSREMIEAWAANPEATAVYAVHTPWWSIMLTGLPQYMPYHIPGGTIPCDPRGSVLMEGPFRNFWTYALTKPEHYGTHGIDALIAAFHGNVEVMTSRGWRPTSLDNWDCYNRLIDESNQLTG